MLDSTTPNSAKQNTIPIKQQEIMQTSFSSKDCPLEVTAEIVLSELKQVKYPAIHVRQLRRKTSNKNLHQSNCMFLPLHVIMYTAEQNARNVRDLIGLFHFKLHVEDYSELRRRVQCYGCQTLVINFALSPQNEPNAEEKNFPVYSKIINKTFVNGIVANNILSSSQDVKQGAKYSGASNFEGFDDGTT
jgi:hypothetical protein